MPYLTPPTIPTEFVTRVIRVPKSSRWLGLVGGALSLMGYYSEWERLDGVPIADAADTAKEIYRTFVEGGYMIGAMMPFATINPPDNMLRCDGASHLRSDYPLLWELLPIAVKSGTEFFTPDMRGFLPIGAGMIQYSIRADVLYPYDTYGAAEHTLTENEMPAHTHANTPHTHTYERPVIGVDFESVGVPDLSAVGNPPLPFETSPRGITIQQTGGDLHHENMPPVKAFEWGIIAR